MVSKALVIIFSLLISVAACNAAGQRQGSTIKVIKSRHGDIYDCVHKYHQPAFDHPASKNHKIQMKPSKEIYETLNLTYSRAKTQLGLKEVELLLEEACPSNTVPIHRMTANRNSTKHWLVSPPSKAWKHGYEFAGFRTQVGSRPQYYGTGASMTVFSPKVRSQAAQSGATIGVQTGDASLQEQIDAGWMVLPDMFKDDRPHLITSWTKDMFKTTGCYNTVCPGYIQTNNQFALGMTLPTSVLGRQLQAIRLTISQDPSTGHWWLLYADANIPIGYWPRWLFTTLQEGAKKVYWGGQVYTPPDQDRSPQMGSGYFKDSNFTVTAMMYLVLIVNEGHKLQAPDKSSVTGLESRCYWSELDFSNPKDGFTFYYGGKGGYDGDTCVSASV